MNIEKIAKDLDFEIEDVMMLLEVFLVTSKKSLENIFNAIESEDYETIYKAAHSIKGSAANLLLEDISEQASNIEKNARNKELVNYTKLGTKLESYITKIEKNKKI